MQTMNAVVKRQAVEKRIVRSAVKELLAAGFTLGVDNGGMEDDEEIKQLSSAAGVLREMFQTDDERLYAYRDGVSVGWLYFVYGNDGWDVLCDYTVNLEQYLTGTSALIDKLSD